MAARTRPTSIKTYARKKRKRHPDVSDQEFAEIQLLQAEGQHFKDIATRMSLPVAVVKRVLKAGDPKDLRLPPPASLDTSIRRIQHIVNTMLRDILTGNAENTVDLSLQIHRLSVTIRNLEEVNEATSLRAKVLVSEDIMTWMLNKRYQGSLDQIQEYHDTALNLM